MSLKSKFIPVTALIMLFIFLIKSSIYNPEITVGNDLLWHLEYGKRIIETRGIPQTDWLSWTFEGTNYQVTQWLGQVVLAGAHIVGGSTLLNLVLASTLSLIFGLSWLTARLYLKSSFLALLVALLTCHQVFAVNARPQVFGFAMFAALVWLLAVWFEQKKRWALLCIPVVLMLWANLHGSFIVGVLYIAALGGGAWMASFYTSGWNFPASVKLHFALAVSAFTAIFATLINPYGYEAYLYVLSISQLETTTSGLITEWRATSMSTMNGPSFILISLLSFVAMLLSNTKATPQRAVGFVGTVYFGLSADRQTYFAVIAMVPFLAQALSDSKITELMSKSDEPKASAIHAILSVSAMGALWFILHSLSASFIENQFQRLYPVAAVKWLNENKIEGRIFNHMESGGYIGSTGRKVFFDGRLDLFGDKFSIGTLNALEGKTGWRDFIERYKPEIYILKNDDELKKLLTESMSLPVAYEDDYHSVIIDRR